MKTVFYFLPVLSLLIISNMAFTHKDDPDAVVGTWLNATKRGHVQIIKKGNTYIGKLIWIIEPNNPATGKPKTDFKNTVASKRSRLLLNLQIMSDFVYDGGNVWRDGKIYNPEDGKEYNCRMTLKNPNTLDVRGYVGISLLGKTQTWTRIE